MDLGGTWPVFTQVHPSVEGEIPWNWAGPTCTLLKAQALLRIVIRPRGVGELVPWARVVLSYSFATGCQGHCISLP